MHLTFSKAGVQERGLLWAVAPTECGNRDVLGTPRAPPRRVDEECEVPCGGVT